ncbi:CLUMA_CG016695, isoform A [Clunio marinus]|uniref:CLUMA_CG016695, isoform A n=1 Tax=Clunio marinus TaxID=568069 RepID=A0A1J1IUA5_9DIPT|nr:CLUMA_CG016695, isoform A [Clunio marinus]
MLYFHPSSFIYQQRINSFLFGFEAENLHRIPLTTSTLGYLGILLNILNICWYHKMLIEYIRIVILLLKAFVLLCVHMAQQHFVEG